MRFNKNYLFLTIALFIIEAGIAVFIHDSFVRPFLGDVLVILLMYCFLKIFLKISDCIVALFVLLFAYSIEILQYLHVADRLGLHKHTILSVVLGSTFDWMDILAYTVGFAIVLLIEFAFLQRVARKGTPVKY